MSYVEAARGVYKKLIVRDDRLLGAIVMGDGAIVPSLLRAFGDGSTLASNRAELLFPLSFDTRPPSVESIPDDAQICDCNAVSKAEIVQAVLGGATSVQSVCAATRAGTGCGTCRPQVQAIADFVRRKLDVEGDVAAAPFMTSASDATSGGSALGEDCA